MMALFLVIFFFVCLAGILRLCTCLFWSCPDVSCWVIWRIALLDLMKSDWDTGSC